MVRGVALEHRLVRIDRDQAVGAGADHTSGGVGRSDTDRESREEPGRGLIDVQDERPIVDREQLCGP